MQAQELRIQQQTTIFKGRSIVPKKKGVESRYALKDKFLDLQGLCDVYEDLLRQMIKVLYEGIDVIVEARKQANRR